MNEKTKSGQMNGALEISVASPPSKEKDFPNHFELRDFGYQSGSTENRTRRPEDRYSSTDPVHQGKRTRPRKKRESALESSSKLKIAEDVSVESVDEGSFVEMSIPILKYRHRQSTVFEEGSRRHCREAQPEKKGAETANSDTSKQTGHRAAVSRISASRQELEANSYDADRQTDKVNKKIPISVAVDSQVYDISETTDCLVNDPAKHGTLSPLASELCSENDSLINGRRVDQTSPARRGSEDTFANVPNCLPDIRIHWQPKVNIEPDDGRKWNCHIGETTRAFVFSYFDHLPTLTGSEKKRQKASTGVKD